MRMTAFEWVQIAALFSSGLGMPVVLYLIGRSHSQRAAAEANDEARMDHLDECIDDLKLRVLGSSVTRGDLDAALLRLREGITADTNGLHQRIMRLENIYLREQRA